MCPRAFLRRVLGCVAAVGIWLGIEDVPSSKSGGGAMTLAPEHQLSVGAGNRSARSRRS
jgi:hypothetical protein